MSIDRSADFDAIVIGGGPTGATTGLCLARAGRSVLIIEKASFPRFHIGESLVPQNMEILRDLGLLEELSKLPQVEKTGAEFTMGNGQDTTRIRFTDSLLPGVEPTFNIERAAFDDCLLKAAEQAGAEVLQGAGVETIETLEDGRVELITDGRTITAKVLVDASGQSTVLGRHLKTRKNFDQPGLQKIAYFGHFTNVKRSDGLDNGNIVLVMCEEAWFWMIPIDEHRTSIGMVLDTAVARQVKRPAQEMLFWGIERCPAVRRRLLDAGYPEKNGVISNYSYACKPYAGPGYFLVGDAATFIDPVFSTGIYLGMEGGRNLANLIDQQLSGKLSPEAARRRHIRFLEHGTKHFFRIIRHYYRHSFRELFLNGSGPMKVHRAVIAVLTGQVMRSTPWPVRWRLKLFDAFVALQQRFTLVPKRDRFSLLSQDGDARHEAEPLPIPAAEAFAET